jgi:hypothetical protein
MTSRKRDVTINISGISVSGVGGLGLVAMAVLTTFVLPQAWWLVLFGAVGGVLLGVALVLVGRHHTPSGPSGNDPRILFRAAPENAAAKQAREDREFPLHTTVVRPA